MEGFKALNQISQPAFKDSILLLPIVSLANVSQLACDLLILQHGLVLVGTLGSRNSIPVVASHESDQMTGFLSPVEVYQSQDSKITLIHQRSPPLKARKDAFIHSILSFIQEAQFGRVLLVASMDASIRTDSDIQSTNPFRLYSPTTPSSQSISDIPILTDLKTITASGLTKRFFTQAKEMDVALDALLMYVVEGDNRQDARLLAQVLARDLWHEQDVFDFKDPKSWNLALYGAEQNQAMFG